MEWCVWLAGLAGSMSASLIFELFPKIVTVPWMTAPTEGARECS